MKIPRPETCINTGMEFPRDHRFIGGGSVGSPRYDGDIWSQRWTVEDFLDNISEYNYLYFVLVDDIFIEEYADAFHDINDIKQGTLVKFLIRDSKIEII